MPGVENAPEAAVVDGLQVIPIRHLREAVAFLEGEIKINAAKVDLAKSSTNLTPKKDRYGRGLRPGISQARLGNRRRRRV